MARPAENIYSWKCSYLSAANSVWRHRAAYMYRLLEAAAAMRLLSGCHAMCSSLALKSWFCCSAKLLCPSAPVLPLATGFFTLLPRDSPNLFGVCSTEKASACHSALACAWHPVVCHHVMPEEDQ